MVSTVMCKGDREHFKIKVRIYYVRFGLSFSCFERVGLRFNIV